MIDSENTTSDEGQEDSQDNASADNSNSARAELPIVSPITSSRQEDSADSSALDRIDNNEFSTHAADLDMIDDSEYSIEPDDSAEIDSTEQPSTQTEFVPSPLDSASLKSLIRSSADTTEKTLKADTHTEINESEVIGQILNEQFVIVDIIGRGEASLVFSGMDLESQELFAIKTPKRSDLNEEFRAAALLHGKLKHPNIAKTRAYLEAPSGLAYLIMENVQGASLKQLFDSMQTIEAEETIAVIVSQICDALEEAHKLNIVHGKLSPGNIFLTEQNERLCIKVLDFAVADALSKDSTTSGSTKNPYRSPENTSSVESDIYSLGVITYQMVAGRLPDVQLSSLGETQLASIASFRPDLSCIQALDQVLAEALDHNPDWRLDSAASFKKGVEEWITAVRPERCKQALSSSELSNQAVVLDPISSGNAPESVQKSQLKTTGSETGIQTGSQMQRQHLTGIQRAGDKVRSTLLRLVALANQPLELVRQEPEESVPTVSTLPNFNDGSSLVGQLLFDSYAIMEVLKERPTTITYLAKHLYSNRQLVLKTVRHRSLFEVFSRDVRAQAALKHPNVVEHLGYVEAADGTPFSVSEFVEGGASLDDLLSSCGSVETEEDLAEIVLELIDAIAHAHGLGIVHANLKPTNILFCIDTEAATVNAKVLDFCPAKAKAELALASLDETLCSKLDFNFMSPEQVLHGISTFNTDIYSIGQLVYMLATGRPTHPFSTLTELKMRFSNPDCPVSSYSLIDERPDWRAIDSLDGLLKRATVIDPANRLQSIEEFKSGFDSWIEEVRSQKTEEQRQQNLEVKRQRGKEAVKQTIYNLVSLRNQQLDQEQTVMMKFASAAATSGPRQSPVKSATRLISLIVATCLISVGGTVYVFTNFEQLKSIWSDASLSLASLFSKKSTVPELTLENKPKNKTTPGKSKAANKTQQAAGPEQSTSSQSVGAPQHRFKYEESSDYAQYTVKTKFGSKRLDEPPSPGSPPATDPTNLTPPRSSQVYSSEVMSKWANRMKSSGGYGH